jgi:hypothetical protein
MERRPGTRRRLSRRGFLAGSGALIAAGGAAAAGIALTRGGDSSPASPATATPTPGTPTPSPTPTPTGKAWLDTPPDTLIEEAPGAWIHEDLDLAQPVDWAHGVLILDTATKRLTGWRLDENALPPAADDLPPGITRTPFSVDVAPGAGIFQARTYYPELGWLHFRSTGKSYRWRHDRLQIAAWSNDWLLFEYRLSASLPMVGTGQLVILDPRTMAMVAGFEVPRSQFSPAAAFSPDGRWLAIATRPAPGEQPGIYFVDVPGGSVIEAFRPPMDIDARQPTAVNVLPHEDGVIVTLSYSVPGEYDPARPPFSRMARLAWGVPAPSAPLLDAEDIDLYFGPPLSADGRFLVRDEHLRYTGGGGGIAGGERWPAATLYRADGTPVFRVRSATVLYGDWLIGRWLADSSAFTAAVHGRPPAGSGPWDSYRYVLVGVDGTITPLPPLPPRGPEVRWFEGSHNRGPVPAPDDPDLISFGRIDLLRRSTGEWTSIRLGPRAEPGHTQPWVAGHSREMVLALGHGGHDGYGIPAWANPVVEYPPFDDSMTLAVATDGDCLNLRDRAEPAAPVIRCLPDGTRLELAEFTPPHADAPQSTWWSEDGARWVYVRTPQGELGWVAMDYIAWAGTAR